MNDEPLGPFRRDGRMHFASETRHDEAAQRALRIGASLEFPGYVFVLSLGPVAIAVATSAWWALGITAFLLLIAWKMQQSFALGRKNAAAQESRRTWITEDGVFLDGILGPAKWEWEAIDDVRIAGSYVVVQFASREVLALPAVGAEAERMVAFVRERSQRRLVDNPGRLLFLLALLYAACVVAALVFLL